MATPNSNRTRWLEVTRGLIPSGPGVYVVYQDDIVVYVGSTTELRARVAVYFTRHRTAVSYDQADTRPRYGTPWGFRHDGTRIRVKVKRSRRLGDWLMWEWRLIHRLQPACNRSGIRG